METSSGQASSVNKRTNGKVGQWGGGGADTAAHVVLSITVSSLHLSWFADDLWDTKKLSNIFRKGAVWRWDTHCKRPSPRRPRSHS